MSYFKYDPDKQDYEDYLVSSLKKLGVLPPRTKRFPQEFTEENDYYIVNDQQITIRPGDGDYKEFRVDPIPKDFSIKYGCELETCFVLNCTTKEFDDYLQEELKEARYLRRKKKKDRYNLKWEELVLYHIKINLSPRLSKKFLKKFPYGYITGYHTEEGIYVDMKTGDVLEKEKKVDSYETLLFSQDRSVVCGDSPYEEEKSLSVHCEIVSPILTDLSEIKLIYENLISPVCNISNESAGFHVNVSAVNEKGKQIELTPGLLFEICRYWYPFEKKNYATYRGEGSKYAKDVSKFVDFPEAMRYLVFRNDGEEISDKEVRQNTHFIREIFYVDEIMDKYTSLHKKPNTNILEFRVFPSKNTLDDLIEYTKKGIDVVTKGLKSFNKSYTRIAREYFEAKTFYNLELKIFDDMDYEGTLTLYDFLNFQLNGVKDHNEMFKDWSREIKKIIPVTTTYLFFFSETRNQILIDYEEGLVEGDHLYISYDKHHKLTIRINYDPKNNYIKIYDFTSVKG